MSRRLIPMLAAAVLVAAGPLTMPAAASASPRPDDSQGNDQSVEPARRRDVDPAKRDDVLGQGWRDSRDLAWTTSGDASGFHILVAAAKDGYVWRTVATLSEPGFDTDTWIGNACVSGSGTRAAVVYAPRTFSNEADLFERGGFTALVNLITGKVTKLPTLSTIAYFNPGCGPGETAVFTAFHDAHGTRLTELDMAKGSLAAPVTVPGQLTSAIPVQGRIVAAANNSLVRIDRSGKVTATTPTTGVAYRLTAGATGKVTFLEHARDRARVRHADPSSAQEAVTLAEGGLTELDLTGSATGQVFITGKAHQTRAMPAGVRHTDLPKGATVSTRGELALSRVGFANPKLIVSDPSAPRGVQIDATAMATGRKVMFRANADLADKSVAASGAAMHPKLAVSHGVKTSGARSADRLGSPDGVAVNGSLQLLGSPTGPVEDERYCSVPRNDPRNQALQPLPRQVEWAVDQAITGTPYAARAADWMNLGMPAYSPLGLFPRHSLVGGSGTGRIPAQVLLGLLAQESNLWQAARFALPGVTANPLIGNYYGLQIYNSDESDDWDIHWNNADCGYGVGQITDGMRLAGHERPGETAYAYQTQRAVALDYAVNVAAAAQMLQDKWNETRAAGLIINDGDPANIENWFYALWAYNSGFHPQSEASSHGGAWGVGWLNNPANPIYPANRLPFLAGSYDDARHPSDWSYPERVIGYAAFPPDLPSGPDTVVSAFRAAWWGGIDGTEAALHRLDAKPPVDLFCDASNDCDYEGVWHDPYHDPSDPSDPDPAGPCTHQNSLGQYNLECWYHLPASWKDCNSECGYELLRFDPYWEEQADGTSYPPSCDSTQMNIPANAYVVDDIPNSDADGPLHSVRPCTRQYSYGSFTLDFASDNGLYPSKVDFHQIGAGFDGHFWFAHTRSLGNDGAKMKVTGTWDPGVSFNQWVRFLVHIPDHGAHTRQAKYELDLGTGSFDPANVRVIQQRIGENRWVSLGAMPVNGVPRIRLSTVTQDGAGDEDIAWDAAAFEPLYGAPANRVVALGDSYSSGEGATSDFHGSDYYHESDWKPEYYGDDPNYVTRLTDACHRSTQAWSRKAVLADDPDPIGSRADSWDGDMDYHFLACSGAVAANIRAGGYSRYHEIAQLDAGFVNQYTTLVTLSIGGNDAKFSDILEVCSEIFLLVGADCQDVTLSGDTQPLDVAEPDRINGPFRTAVKDVLKSIHAKAPNAKILLLGYPHLMEDEGWCANVFFGSDNIAWFDAMADLLVTSIQGAISDAVAETGMPASQIAFGDARPAFAGHGACADVEYINGPVYTKSKADISGPVSQQSFHPNLAGTTAYATVMRDVLDGTNWGM